MLGRSCTHSGKEVALPAEGVDRNLSCRSLCLLLRLSPSRGGRG